jgi:hypothetical protein
MMSLSARLTPLPDTSGNATYQELTRYLFVYILRNFPQVRGVRIDMQTKKKPSRVGLPIMLMIANGVFWLFFAVNFAVVSQPYHPHVKHFEEASSPYIFWGHALPFEQFTSSFINAAHLIELPSFYAAAVFNLYCSRRGIVVDDLYLGVSEGGYYLLLVFLISFLQWYLYGLLAQFVAQLIHRRVSSPD